MTKFIAYTCPCGGDFASSDGKALDDAGRCVVCGHTAEEIALLTAAATGAQAEPMNALRLAYTALDTGNPAIERAAWNAICAALGVSAERK